MDDLYGFKAGELVQWVDEPWFGRVLGRTSAEGRLLVEVRVNGRRQEFAVLPSRIKPLATQEARQ